MTGKRTDRSSNVEGTEGSDWAVNAVPSTRCRKRCSILELHLQHSRSRAVNRLPPPAPAARRSSLRKRASSPSPVLAASLTQRRKWQDAAGSQPLQQTPHPPGGDAQIFLGGDVVELSTRFATTGGEEQRRGERRPLAGPYAFDLLVLQMVSQTDGHSEPTRATASHRALSAAESDHDLTRRPSALPTVHRLQRPSRRCPLRHRFKLTWALNSAASLHGSGMCRPRARRKLALAHMPAPRTLVPARELCCIASTRVSPVT